MARGTTRRELFRLAGGLVLATAGGAVPDGGLDRAAGAALARRWLRDPAAARRLGEHYLGAHPGEADPAFLLEASLGPGDLAGARDRFARRRRAEFEHGDTVELAGWVVARCEARLCALLRLA